MYLEAAREYAGVEDMAAWCVREAAMIACALGDTARARKALAGALRAHRTARDDGEWARALYVPDALEGKTENAVRTLTGGIRAAGLDNARSSWFGFATGWLREAHGDNTGARGTWRLLSRSYPAPRFCAIAEAAAAFGKGVVDPARILALPFDRGRVSELLYWCAKARERRGDRPLARRLMTEAVRCDPSLRWPAYLARQSLRPVRSQRRLSSR
jgi:hypothetical protein